MFVILNFIVLCLVILPAVAFFYYTGKRKALARTILESRRTYSELLDEYSRVKDENRTLNRRATDVENLYEITRKMSKALEFDDIFKTFNEFLNRGIRFRECKLLLIAKENGNPFIEKAYKMRHPFGAGGENIKVSTPELKDEIALDLFNVDQRPIFLAADRDGELLSRFYRKESVQTLATNPLIVEDELIGILVVEDLNRKDFDKFLILAGQFAMEIKKVKLYEEIQELAIIDGLTGAYMRRHFLERVKEEIKRAEHHKLNVSFLLVDMDHFKFCNDRHGHLVGDAVLNQLAGILKKNLREIDIICRYGGEEFAIAMPDTGKDAAMVAAERIRETVEGFTFEAYDDSVNMTISIGISSYPSDGKKTKQLIEAADRGLYKAKHTGRNKVCIT